MNHLLSITPQRYNTTIQLENTHIQKIRFVYLPTRSLYVLCTYFFFVRAALRLGSRFIGGSSVPCVPRHMACGGTRSFTPSHIVGTHCQQSITQTEPLSTYHQSVHFAVSLGTRPLFCEQITPQHNTQTRLLSPQIDMSSIFIPYSSVHLTPISVIHLSKSQGFQFKTMLLTKR